MGGWHISPSLSGLQDGRRAAHAVHEFHRAGPDDQRLGRLGWLGAAVDDTDRNLVTREFGVVGAR